jgi:glycosyltransferase involved in cell wall biosynthesis
VQEEFGVQSDVVANGVDAARFADCPLDRAAAGGRFGWGDRPVVLAVGGIEPRKGSRLLIEAFARARGRLGDGALLAIGGGETMFDYHEYREAWRGDAARLGLEVHEGPPGEVPDGADVVILGTIDDDEMASLYRASDALAFPSTREGFGLVVLEALASGIPAVVTDLPVLREHLEDGRDCIMVPAGDSGPLSNALVSAVHDTDLRARLLKGGRRTVARFTWAACAEEHERLYRRMLG